LDQLVQDIATTRYIKSELEKNDISKLLPAVPDMADTHLSEMIRTYNEMVSERNLRLQSMDDNSPLVQKKTTSLTEMRTAILASVDQSLDILTSRLKALQLIDTDNRNKLSNAPNQTRYLMSEDRKQKVMESLYVYLLQRREENELSQAFSAYNTRMVTEPYGEDLPASPDPRKVLAIAFLLSLMLPTGLIYLREITNNKVRSRDDLNGLGVPYVGEIPNFNKKNSGIKIDDHTIAREILVRPHTGDLINEAFRMVRTNIEFMRRSDRKASEVMMVVSLVPGSGKTFISLNLAASFAIKGHKVCLLDMDLRKGTLSQSVNSPRIGLTDVIVGGATLDEAIIRNTCGIEGFDILPEGTVPANPTELLFSPRVKAMLDDLRARYEYIIIDCPPAEAVADAKVINKFVAMTVFVVRSGLLERSNLPLIQEYYDAKRFNNMAIVLNGTEELHGAYGRYGYGNGYGRGKGYGYSYGQRSRKK
ncbi:MAG: polysaccharide biosynthesis tyrosine autokinase, partial [Muribaculaceae bacterium]|nr:polysaccharide biosynthesis tyrosine autokinase [Muribaculaceae bacterium]